MQMLLPDSLKAESLSEFLTVNPGKSLHRTQGLCTILWVDMQLPLSILFGLEVATQENGSFLAVL